MRTPCPARGRVCGVEPARGSEEVGEEHLLDGLLDDECGGKKAEAGGQTLYPALTALEGGLVRAVGDDDVRDGPLAGALAELDVYRR